MPNSRLETTRRVTAGDVDDAGGWLRIGNSIGSGGGDRLGSVDDFRVEHIINDITRGGYNTDGSRFLVENEAFSDREFNEVMRSGQSIDDSIINLFSFSIPDGRVFAFDFNFVYMNTTRNIFGRLSKSVLFQKNGPDVFLSQETTRVTEKEGNKEIDIKFKNLSNVLSIEGHGIDGETIKFSGKISYHGLLNNI